MGAIRLRAKQMHYFCGHVQVPCRYTELQTTGSRFESEVTVSACGMYIVYLAISALIGRHLSDSDICPTAELGVSDRSRCQTGVVFGDICPAFGLHLYFRIMYVFHKLVAEGAKQRVHTTL